MIPNTSGVVNYNYPIQDNLHQSYNNGISTVGPVMQPHPNIQIPYNLPIGHNVMPYDMSHAYSPYNNYIIQDNQSPLVIGQSEGVMMSEENRNHTEKQEIPDIREINKITQEDDWE